MAMLDWAIVATLLLCLAGIALYTNRYVRSVADFLAANRLAGRYLVTLSDGVAGLGAISIVAIFQMIYHNGFAPLWWDIMFAPVMMLVTLSGFIVYRFRETRAMTMAQFFEMRYSRRFRVFTGILAVISGILNYGIFPGVTARFIICLTRIPTYSASVGPLQLDLTLGAVMAVLLGLALYFTFKGGQIAIIVTDFLQSQFMNIAFMIVLVALFWKFSWHEIVDTLKAHQDGTSMLNPFDQAELRHFTLTFFIIRIFNSIYGYLAWQGNQGYNCSAKSPHEAKMARVLSSWRLAILGLVTMMLPVCAYVLMHGQQHVEAAAEIQQTLSGVTDEYLYKQMEIPLAIHKILPAGILGLLVAAVLAAAVSTDDTYLHSWGSIFVQDVIMPFRKKKMGQDEHIRWLRWSILGVAAFAWLFSMLFPVREYVFMYFAITGSIFIGGAGAVIIGGFYWPRATTAGAWAGMITGSILGLSGTLLNNLLWPKLVPFLKASYPNALWIQGLPEVFWLDGMHLSFVTALVAVAMFIMFSLLTKRDPGFEMAKILHRGKYAIKGEHAASSQSANWLTLFGYTKECTRFDTFLILLMIGWVSFWFLIFIVGNVIGVLYETTDNQWANYWLFNIVFSAIVSVVTIAWFTWGGFRDLFRMFRDLEGVKRDALDDGTVERHDIVSSKVADQASSQVTSNGE